MRRQTIYFVDLLIFTREYDFISFIYRTEIDTLDVFF